MEVISNGQKPTRYLMNRENLMESVKSLLSQIICLMCEGFKCRYLVDGDHHLIHVVTHVGRVSESIGDDGIR